MFQRFRASYKSIEDRVNSEKIKPFTREQAIDYIRSDSSSTLLDLFIEMLCEQAYAGYHPIKSLRHDYVSLVNTAKAIKAAYIK